MKIMKRWDILHKYIHVKNVFCVEKTINIKMDLLIIWNQFFVKFMNTNIKKPTS